MTLPSDCSYCSNLDDRDHGCAQRSEPPRPSRWEVRGGSWRIPAITDFRAKGTIMGPTGLTAVFGMGTGVTPPVWSPEKHPAGGQAAPGTGFNRWSDHAVRTVRLVAGRPVSPLSGPPRPRTIGPRRLVGGQDISTPRFGRRCPERGEADGSGWSSIRLLELVRCGGRPPYTPSPSTWSSSRSLRT